MSNKNYAVIAENLHKSYSLQRHKTFKEFLPALFLKDKLFNRFEALKGINFELEQGKSLGLIGSNGSGKSTLLKLIAGVTKPSDGRITINGTVAPLIELGAGFHPELTGRENVYLNGSILGKRKKDMDKLFKNIVDFAGLWEFIDQPVKHYSSGMYMRLAFSVAVSETPDILLVDEILSVGDIDFQKKCLQKINEFKKSGSTLIMVSHSIEQIKNYCDVGLTLSSGNQLFFGNIDKAIEKYKQSL